MTFDEFLLIAVIVMLGGSMLMAMSVQLSLHRSRQSMNLLINEFMKMAACTVSLDSEVLNLKRRVKELENG